jgi:hypothetical protein
MKEAVEYDDYSENLIRVKQLVVDVERLFNDRNFIECLAAATELCTEAREMKHRLHKAVPMPHIVKDE